MVLFILRLLPQKDLVTVSKINKKLRDLTRDDSLWTELTLAYETSSITPTAAGSWWTDAKNWPVLRSLINIKTERGSTL